MLRVKFISLMTTKVRRVSFFAAMFFSVATWAQSRSNIEVGVTPMQSFNDVILSSQMSTGGNTFSVHAHFYCFGTNLRGVSNPLSPDSTIVMRMKNKSNIDGIEVRLPAKVVTRSGARSVDASEFSVKASGGVEASIAALRNSVRIDLKGFDLGSLGKDFRGNYRTGRKTKLLSFEFEQEGSGLDSKHKYMGYNGRLTARVRKRLSNRLKMLNLYVFLPGQRGFCGGYYSPIMLFFEQEGWPEFNAVTDFPINPAGLDSYWPEAGAIGYFLVDDKNGDGIVNDSGELFGAEKTGENGFELLKELDANGDGVLNHRDGDKFTRLKLWKDRNANGKTDQGEMVSITSMGVQELSLKYELVSERFDERAEARERSTFKYKRGSEVHTGRAVDLWFSAAPEAQKLADH